MKKSFKRFLSSVLAAVMAVAGMSIGMATNVMAADNQYELYCNSSTSDDYVNTSNYFTTGSTARQTTVGNLVTDTASYITNIAGTALDLTAAGMAMKGNSSLSIAFTTSATTSDVTIWWAPKGNTSNSGTYKLNIDGAQVGDTLTGDEGLQKIETTVSSGAHTITKTSGASESVVYYVRVDENFSESAADYTITGTSNLSSGDEFIFDGETAKVGEGGAWTITLTRDNAPVAGTDKFDVSKEGYSVAPNTVTLTATEDTYTYTVADELEFTKYVFTEIPAGKYTAAQIEEGLPYFDLTNLSISSTGKYNNSSSFDIWLSDTATVTINGKSGSGTTGNDATAYVNGVAGTTMTAGGSFTDDKFTNVPAGTATISFVAGTTYQISSITIAYETSQTYTWTLNTSNLTLSLAGTLGLAQTTTNGTTNTLTYDGTDYTIVSGCETVTGTPDESYNITVTPEDSWFEEYVVGSNVITDKATLVADATVYADVFNSDSKTALASDVEYGKFTFINGLSMESRSDTVDGFDAFAYRIKTGGASTVDSTGITYRGIKFETAGPATLQIIGYASDSGRSYTVYDSTGTLVTDGSEEMPTACAAMSTVTLPSAGVYYVGSNKAIYIESITVVVGSGTSDATGGKIFAGSADSYAVATLSTADLANATLNIAIGDYTDSTKDVFESAVIDGILMNASDFGADYIYVTKVEGANGETFDFTTDFTEAVSE